MTKKDFHFILDHYRFRGSPGGSVVKNSPAKAGEAGDEVSIFELGRSPGEGNGNTLQYPCLGNHKNRGAWRATVHGVAKSQLMIEQLSTVLTTVGL